MRKAKENIKMTVKVYLHFKIISKEEIISNDSITVNKSFLNVRMDDKFCKVWGLKRWTWKVNLPSRWILHCREGNCWSEYWRKRGMQKSEDWESYFFCFCLRIFWNWELHAVRSASTRADWIFEVCLKELGRIWEWKDEAAPRGL